MTKAVPNSAVFETYRTIPHTAAEIYAAFADPTQLAIWWGPDGFSNTFEHFDFQVGGRWRFVMYGPDGAQYPNECEFKVLEPATCVVIAHIVVPYFTLTVSLLPVESDTRIQWHQAFDDPKVAAAIRHIVEPSNEQNLDRLQRHLQGK